MRCGLIPSRGKGEERSPCESNHLLKVKGASAPSTSSTVWPHGDNTFITNWFIVRCGSSAAAGGWEERRKLWICHVMLRRFCVGRVGRKRGRKKCWVNNKLNRGYQVHRQQTPRRRIRSSSSPTVSQLLLLRFSSSRFIALPLSMQHVNTIPLPVPILRSEFSESV